MRIYMDGNNGIVIKRLNAQIRQRVNAEVFLCRVLDIAHIGVYGAQFEIFHVVFNTGHGTLITNSKIQCSSCGRVEEGAYTFQHIVVLRIFIRLHLVVGRIDHGGLELLSAAFHSEVDAAVSFKVGIILCLYGQGLDDFTPDDIQRCVRKRPLHGVGCLDKTGKTGQHRQFFLKGLYGVGQQL